MLEKSESFFQEVAEAIYYARRIRSQSGNVERERESPTAQRKRAELEGQRKRAGAETTSKENGRPIRDYRTVTNRGGVQRDLPEKREFAANPEWWNYEPKTRRRHELRGFRAGVGHRNPDYGEITIDDASGQMKMIQETKNVFGSDREPETPPG